MESVRIFRSFCRAFDTAFKEFEVYVVASGTEGLEFRGIALRI